MNETPSSGTRMSYPKAFVLGIVIGLIGYVVLVIQAGAKFNFIGPEAVLLVLGCGAISTVLYLGLQEELKQTDSIMFHRKTLKGWPACGCPFAIPERYHG